MAIIKCKMCGGDLNITEGVSVAECEYCGTKQTVPNVDNEKKTSLFLRAEKLRRECDFDRAAAIYDSIITDFPAEPEAYWGLLLCKYGIEYVDDPATGKKVPTCHRSSFDSVMGDENLKQVMGCADTVARKVYRDEAKAIEEIRKGILEVSGKEPPYDIFICYKETDENKERTIDSVLAQDVYDALIAKGYRVFFSRITLEDKLGTEYEPYIFAALNSAKVMLVFGTDYEYFNAVWVKNEWSRYLKLMAQDKSKHLIPCYKDVDAYDLPEEFQKLQAQDLGKVGAIQDLLRGIEKLLPRKQETVAPQPAAGGPTAESLLKRGQMFLEDGEWKSADEYFDKVLDIDPECAEAYLGKFCAEQKYRSPDRAAENADFRSSPHWEKALRFASPELRAQLEEWKKAAEELRVRRQTKAAKRQEEDARQREEKARQQEESKKRLAPIRPFAQGMLAAGPSTMFGLRADGTVVSAGENDKGQRNVSDWRDIVAIAAGADHTVGLQADGTVVAVGDNKCGQCNVSGWQDIVAVLTEYSHTIGLRSDGTVSAVGSNDDGQCNVSNWRDIVAIAAGGYHTIGLRANGTVIASGYAEDGRCDVSDWKDIVAIAAEDYYTVGLRANGTVVAVGDNDYGQCNVSDWRDITAIAAEYSHIVGLRADGTVVAAGDNNDGQCNVSDWREIVAIAAGSSCTVGLRADGTVVAVGDNDDGQCNVSDWREIVAIAAKDSCTYGLRADGTVVAVGNNEEGCCDVENWKLFDTPEQLKEEREAVQQRVEEARRQKQERQKQEIAQRRAALGSERDSLQAELANLKGLFTGKRRKELETRLAEIEAELKKL